MVAHATQNRQHAKKSSRREVLARSGSSAQTVGKAYPPIPVTHALFSAAPIEASDSVSISIVFILGVAISREGVEVLIVVFVFESGVHSVLPLKPTFLFFFVKGLERIHIVASTSVPTNTVEQIGTLTTVSSTLTQPARS